MTSVAISGVDMIRASVIALGRFNTPSSLN
jgi:hypothetical protein